MADHAQIIHRVRHLRALAESTSSPEEAATARALADKLTTEHNLTPKDLADAPTIAEVVLDQTDKRHLWKTHLGYAVARHHGCTAYNRWGKTPKGAPWFQICAVGPPAELSHVQARYAMFRLEIGSLSERHKQLEGRSFRIGVVAGLREAFEEERAREVEAQRSTEMVLVSADEEARKAEAELLAVFQDACMQRAPTEEAPADLPASPTITEDLIEAASYLAGKAVGRRIEIKPPKEKT